MSEAPRKRASLKEMARVAGLEAERIRTTQAALVRGQMRDKPHEGEIRRAEVFEDIERLLYAIDQVPDQVRNVLTPVFRAMATKEKFERDREAAPPEATENPDDTAHGAD